ncbi:Type II/IV secretion system ATPase TadZ/CpaE, Flp pilus assembly [Liberibacter crescens BT-1]|uniref:Type II/IV secretion system ATPase TadZ/CpaE, Flp pilus assembly n=1 Tax=Liberibacter crescens (strain BT-1) TaxID=1215343 RepID=L0EUP5_LIBCB|nr:CpaE family protein [Liberibacter crescens]AGA65274.1 Type II/IV secretion system ATPase TadZ/CpaE, Flp pilus assembly [Liberibacter crescens BT-1]AMC13209.1 CtpF protein [Liberibacter crescens]
MSSIEYEIRNKTSSNLRENAQVENIENMRPLPRISIHAFCETETLYNVIEKSKVDRRMARVNVKVTRGSTEAAINTFVSSATPNLIILQTNLHSEKLLSDLERLAEVCDSSTKVIVIGNSNDVSLYRTLIRNGISEYLVEPLSVLDIMKAITNIFMDSDKKSFGRSLAFIGAKGGVGSSTIAHNCAFGIATLFSMETILADLDLPYGTANIDFDQDPAQGISDAIYSPDRLDEVFVDRLLVRCAENLSLLAAPSVLDRSYDFEVDAILSVIEILQKSCPMVILDIPHAWNDWIRKVLVASDKIIITTSLDLANLRNTKNLIDVLRKLRPNDNPPYLVINQENMPKRPEISIEDFCEPLGVRPSAVIPFDIALFGAAANSGKMINEINADSLIAEKFLQLVHILTDRVTIEKPKSGILEKMMGVLKRK